MDKHFERMRAEVPHLKRPPSEYVREHFWFATQPIEEPEQPQHLAELIDWIGWDRMLFSTDYPHWDFDDPRLVFDKIKLSESRRRRSSATTPRRCTGCHDHNSCRIGHLSRLRGSTGGVGAFCASTRCEHWLCGAASDGDGEHCQHADPGLPRKRVRVNNRA